MLKKKHVILTVVLTAVLLSSNAFTHLTKTKIPSSPKRTVIPIFEKMAMMIKPGVPQLKPHILGTMKSIASRPNQEDPFYVLELEDIVYKVQQFRRFMPRVEIFYAVKCNDYETILETLSSLGTSFDCASKGEISKVLSLGVCPSRIIYAHPCKSKLDLEFASKVQVSMMTFDCREELIKIQEVYPKAELVLRICCDARVSESNLGAKFGADVEDSMSLLSLARDLGLQVVGVSFHVGTGCGEIEVYERAIAAARKIFYEGETLGMAMNILDIGGGFPGRRNSGFENFAAIINEALDKHFPANKNNTLRVIAEPGRYMVMSALTLATCIISKRRTIHNNQALKSYSVNAGIYNGFFGPLALSMALSPRVLLCKGRPVWEHDHENTESEISKILGPSYSASDVLIENIHLPPLECGDWLYWPDMGAYTGVVATKCSAYPIFKVHVAMASSMHDN